MIYSLANFRSTIIQKWKVEMVKTMFECESCSDNYVTSLRDWIQHLQGIYFFKKSPIFIHRPQEEEWGQFPLLDFFSFLNLDMPILDKRMPGASAARTTLGRRKGGRDLWEHWDESCLLRRCKLLLHTTSKFQVIGWQEWISNTISKVCDDRTQFGVRYLWR